LLVNNLKERKMETNNPNVKWKQLPGWEQYQSKEDQLKQQMEEGMWGAETFNPSEQEVSLKNRLDSKLDSYQEKEYGIAPVEPCQAGMFTMTGMGLGRGR
jgi:hypothetical protein